MLLLLGIGAQLRKMQCTEQDRTTQRRTSVIQRQVQVSRKLSTIDGNMQVQMQRKVSMMPQESMHMMQQVQQVQQVFIFCFFFLENFSHFQIWNAPSQAHQNFMCGVPQVERVGVSIQKSWVQIQLQSKFSDCNYSSPCLA